jgi:hypothetical protein
MVNENPNKYKMPSVDIYKKESICEIIKPHIKGGSGVN